MPGKMIAGVCLAPCGRGLSVAMKKSPLVARFRSPVLAS